MKEVYVVTRESRKYGSLEFHAFTSEEKANTYAINYLYGKSTLEDRTNNKIQKDECSMYTEYSLYTNEYGEITLRVRKVKVD